MKSMTKMLMALVALAFVAASCGKYEDGPGFSLKSKKARVVNVWSFDKNFVDDLGSFVITGDTVQEIQFLKDGKAVFTYSGPSGTKDYDATWEFSDDKEKLNCYVAHVAICGSTYIDTIEYTILRLTSNEMWLTEYKFNDTYEYHYITK